MPAQDSLPRKIGPYRVIRKIGEGGMGVVYLCEDNRNGEQVALKVLGPAVASDPSARQRLAREVETMRRVKNRFVAEILAADTAGPSPYIVTRYVDGRTLDEAVHQDGPLTGMALDTLAEGLAEALTAIHGAGIVHRDLKPGNVMLDKGRPVLIDFGIAHIQDSARLTKTGLVMGTPGYLAPEVIEGGPSTGKSDVHSWGGTVAYAATGREPFGSGTFQTVFFRVIEGKAELDGVPPRLMPFVAAALRTDPEGRPSARWLAGHLGLPGGAQLLMPEIGATRLDAALTSLDGAATRLDGAATRLDPAAMRFEQPGTRLDGPPVPRYPSTRIMPPPVSPPPHLAPPPMAPQQARVAYRSPAEAAADVADLLPPVAQPSRRMTEPGKAAPAMPAEARRPEWHPHGLGLLTLSFGVAAIALSVLLPVAGTLLSLAVITLLRAADRAQTALAERRDLHRGTHPSDVVLVILAAPWTVVTSALTTIFLIPVALFPAAVAAGAAVVFVRSGTLPGAGSWAAGAAVACYCFGPGSRKPRRQLHRIGMSAIRSPMALTVAYIACWALALAIVSSAFSQPAIIWPATSSTIPHLMPGLPSFGNLLHTAQKWLLHNTVGMLHIP
jgi:predicted Ser/Thr protein kinase